MGGETHRPSIPRRRPACSARSCTRPTAVRRSSSTAHVHHGRSGFDQAQVASTGSTRAVLAHVREPLHRSSSATWSCSCRLSTASSPAWRLVERGGAGYLALLSKAHNLLVGQLKLAPRKPTYSACRSTAQSAPPGRARRSYSTRRCCAIATSAPGSAVRASTTIMLAEAIVLMMRPASLRRQRPRDGVVVGAAVQRQPREQRGHL